MKYKETLDKYFESFSNKDVDTLATMFADDVVLTDWSIFAGGKYAVVSKNQNIFDAIDTIQVTPLTYYSNSDNSYAVRINILIDGTNKLEVIDVIKFDDNGLINYIEAYKI